MRIVISAGAALFLAGQADAESVELQPIADARLRYEHVDQADLPRNADAVTLRVRSGLSASAGKISALVEAQGMLAINDRYFDGLHGGASDRPLVADPQNINLSRAQLRYQAGGFALTAGRQNIALDDERFVGGAAFRQSIQTFDAVRTEWSRAGIKADLSYVWSVRTIWGIDGGGARQQAVSGDNFLANLAGKTPIGTLTGFAYLIDGDEAAVQGYRLSSQTYGLRLVGSHTFSPKVKLSWQGSYARQSDHHRNPNNYRADYSLADLGLDVGPLKLGAGREVLGADNGAPLTSFQTPLATGFKFNGWADKFLTTPPDGLRDLYATAGYARALKGPVKSVSLQATWHHFESDRLVRDYGDEWNLLATAKLGRTLISARYADYQADGFATDTRKFWLQFDWAL